MTAPDAAHEARERIDLGAGYALEPDGRGGEVIRCEKGFTVAYCWSPKQTRAFAAAMQAREARIAELEAALSALFDETVAVARAALATASQSESTP